MKIKLLFFASCKDIVGQRELDVEIEDNKTVRELKDEIIKQFPNLGSIKDVLSVAVNAEYVGDQTSLSAGDEVAFIPPVSGG